MGSVKVITNFLFDDEGTNRKKLFEKSLFHAKDGKVLYILQEELNELPELSQDLSSVDRNYIKMISFLYTCNKISLIESLSSLTEWRNIPSTIIIDSINKFEHKKNMQNICGIVALLVDCARSCSLAMNTTCHLFIAVTKDTLSEDNCNLMKELYISSFL